MKKGTKVTSVMAGVLVMAVLAGCGARDAGLSVSTEQETDTATSTISETTVESPETAEEETVEEDTATTPGGIRENGQFGDGSDLTEEELYYHMGVLFKAIQELDIETVREYTNDNFLICGLKTLKEDPEKVAFWNKVVGEVVYFEDSSLLVAKSPAYVFTKWFADKAESGSEFPGVAEEMSMEEVNEVYNQYYASAPYIGTLLSEDMKIDVEDGYLIFDTEHIFDDIGLSWEEIFHYRTYELNCGALLLSGNFSFNEEWLEWLQEEFPDYQRVKSMDLDEIVSIIEEDLPEEERNGIYWKFYQKYYVPEESRAILQEYFDQNAECHIYDQGVAVYVKANLDLDDPWNNATDEDRVWLEDKTIVNAYYIWDFPEYFEYGFEPFCAAAQTLVRAGELQ